MHYALVIVRLDCRELVWINVTANPTAEWLAQTQGANRRKPKLVHSVAMRPNMPSILVAMMKSFSCSPLIFLVCRETVALPQPKLIFG
jgi:hypothetical protein